jgi:hypothetical protein
MCYCFSDLWGVIVNENLNGYGTTSVDHNKTPLSDDSSSMIEMVIDRLGPFLMAIKDNFDSYAAKSKNKHTVSRQHCLGNFFVTIFLVKIVFSFYFFFFVSQPFCCP